MYYKRKKLKARFHMKPRIFVSSTFYDLKYVREDLANFIRMHDFDPIMFEDSDIGYTPGKPLDESCYEAMSSSDMVILIIGGNYGSPATGEEPDEFDEFISITRREFKTAIEEGVPVFCFIDNKVYTEFSIFEANSEHIETNLESFNFVTTKNINVFRFIREIKNIGNISITEFEKSLQIKEFLGKQWADMFKKYLELLKNNKGTEKLLYSIDTMNRLIKKMDLMVEGIGKKVIDPESEAYSEISLKREVIEYAAEITSCFEMSNSLKKENFEERVEQMNSFLVTLYNSIESEVWGKLGEKEPEPFFQFFDEFDLQSVTYVFEDKLLYLKNVFSDSLKKQALINCLCEDEFYNQLFK